MTDEEIRKVVNMGDAELDAWIASLEPRIKELPDDIQLLISCLCGKLSGTEAALAVHRRAIDKLVAERERPEIIPQVITGYSPGATARITCTPYSPWSWPPKGQS